MKRLAIVAMAVATASLGATAARATVIYDGGSPDQSDIYYADTSYGFTEAAQTFTLASGANTVAGVNWWGGCDPGTCPAADFTINIYSDGGGLPGTLLDTYSVGPADQTATGRSVVFSNWAEYSYSASIPNLTLTAGESYWLGISDTTSTDYIWGWETTNESGGHAQFIGAWLAEPGDLAFNLTGPSVPTPEPGTLALFGAGLFGLLMAARRRRQS